MNMVYMNQNNLHMKSIEIIEIRLSQNLNEVLEKEIANVIKEVMKKEVGCTLKLYNKMHLESDYIVIIYHKHKNTNRGISELGQQLKAAFSEFGMINHSIWDEIL